MNDIENAIEILKCIYPSQKEIVTGEYDGVAEALDLAISALEKQMPKKVTIVGNDYAISHHECPNCNIVLRFSGFQPKTNYCHNCGQKLDWSEENE